MVQNSIQKSAKLMWLCLALAAFLCFPSAARADEGFSDAELDTLVSTIALYPDPLLVHVLTASTFGDQLPPASAWAESHKNLSGESLAAEMEKAELPYDPSVQALIPFPTVLATMAKYRVWSDQLGDAVSFQKDQVLEAIQRMRQAAYDHGHLKSDEQVTVTREEKIVIEPVRTEYVYVPVYNPSVVYYVHADGFHRGIGYRYGVWLGTWYGEWGWGSCWFDWDYHFIYVRDYRWYPHRPIPRHPHHYNPPPRKHHRPTLHTTDRPLKEQLSDRRHQVTPPVKQSPSKKDDSAKRTIKSQAASAKSNSLGVQKSKADAPAQTPSKFDRYAVPERRMEPKNPPPSKSTDEWWQKEQDRRSNNSGWGKAKATTGSGTSATSRDQGSRNQGGQSQGGHSRGNGGFGKSQRR